MIAEIILNFIMRRNWLKMPSEIIVPESLGMIKQEESIKIIKNTKGHQWEFKLLGIVENQFERILAIDNYLESKFNKEVK